jgi:hypothetical protein
MKSRRKINGGLLGSYTKSQIKCIQLFFKRLSLICNNINSNKIEELIKSIQYNRHRHFASKFVKINKSNLELERDNLLIYLIKIFDNLNVNNYSHIISLINQIITNNDKGYYYKEYNEENDTKYKSNYDMFKNVFCNKIEDILKDLENSCEYIDFDDDDSNNESDEPFSLMPSIKGGRKKTHKKRKRKCKSKKYLV